MPTNGETGKSSLYEDYRRLTCLALIENDYKLIERSMATQSIEEHRADCQAE